ncbi:NAD(P)-dependent oxidoreductase [Pedobacter sp. KBW06]|uniref:NAD-dependent epimerase/dehydratase family protein n=1 Tax=Pedobacter sp. KBW06 TaxID=2153359 RepID=UPI000F593304|nr:NAD(P)-dependent oxidoreductase [Pedobacter sp. KBW06]RQO66399.1 NAD(P)-dependent oxidoreductase [Pedobacter sp. KBW06]
MGNRKRILLTGASGTVGNEVLKQLLELQQFEITAFDKKTSNSKRILAPFEKQVNVVYGDIRRAQDVEEACKQQDVVIHLAAVIPPIADQHVELAYEVNVTGTKNLIRGMQKYAANAFLLYSSSISVYGDRLSDPWIKSSDPLIPSPHDNYARTKIESEALIQATELDWCIFRLAAIMGTGNHKASGIMFHMPLNTAMEILSPKDTARAFVMAILHKAELNHQIFNLGGGEHCRITYQDFLRRSFDAFGLGKVDFPEHSFAEKNFHCGYYEDGDELAEIIDFRKDTLESYFDQLKSAVSPFKKTLTRLFRKPIKSRLLKQSEPYDAWLSKDKKMASRFFNEF